ncbi:MAG: PilN domain-containing protein [Pseudomonadota bacterium]
MNEGKSGGDTISRATGALRLRQRLTAFANLVEAGAHGLMVMPPSRRPVLPTRVVLGDGRPMLETRDGETTSRTAFTANDSVAQSLSENGIRRVDLVLADGVCLDLDFTLPEASLSDLKAMIEHEIAFQSPFEAGETLWCWSAERIESGAAASWRVRAALVLAERLRPALDALDEMGIRIGCLRRCGAGGEMLWAADAPWADVIGQGPGATHQRGGVFGALSVLRRLPLTVTAPAMAVLAFFAIAAVRYVSLTIEDQALTAETDRARGALAAASRNALRHSQFEEERYLSALRMAAIGNAAGLLEDDTWLASLSIEDDSFEIAGFGPSAARASERLAEMPGLGALRFASPIARDPRTQMERFRLAGPFGLDEGQTPR